MGLDTGFDSRSGRGCVDGLEGSRVQLVHRSTKVLAQARGRVEERFGFGGDPVVLGDRVHHGTQRSTEAFAAADTWPPG